MNFMKTSILFAAVLTVGMLAGCTKNDNTNLSANGANKTANSANANAPSNANAASNSGDATAGSTAFSLATPTEAYKTAYDCRKRKDIECLKKVMSQDVLDFIKMMGEDDKKSLDDSLKELCERPQAATNESRNEKITGDSATIEYPDDGGTWRTMDFVKIGNEWKMAPPTGPKSPGDKPKKP